MNSHARLLRIKSQNCIYSFYAHFSTRKKKSGDTNGNPLLGTLQRLNELIHMKLLKIWKKKESKNCYYYNYCYSLTLSLLLVLLSPSPCLSLPLSHPLLFSPSTLRNAIKLLYNTSFLYNAYCKSAEP